MTGIQRTKVFIVEDNPEFGDYVLDILESSIDDVDARLFADGVSGLQACLQETPDVVVLDLNLPSLRGEEICRLLKSSPTHRRIRILVCSDMPEAQRREMELLKLGADVYFEKPFIEERFVETVLKLIEEGHSTHGVERAADTTRDEESTLVADGGKASTPRRSSAPSFEGFRILGVVGGGAMGTVYKAEQLNLGRVVALKVFLRKPGEAGDYLERFKREARIMAALNHPNILRVYDSGSTGYTYYISMEFVDGGSLSERVMSGDLDSTSMAGIMLQVCDAVAHLHDNNVIHRDLKPANILITKGNVAKVGDFGISRARLPSEAREFTQKIVLMGTRVYMAPELLMGERANELTDQYALARTFLRLFEGEEGFSPPRPLVSLRPELPRLSAVLARALALDPGSRYPTVRALREAIHLAFETEGALLASPARTANP